MRRLSGLMFVGVICAVVAGCSRPDLTVTGSVDCGTGSPNVSATITNQGPADITIKSWTEQLVTMYPASAFPAVTGCGPNNWCAGPGSGWPQPYTTPSGVTLKKGDSVTVKLGSAPLIPTGWNQYDLNVEVDPHNWHTEANESNNVNQIIIKPCG